MNLTVFGSDDICLINNFLRRSLSWAHAVTSVPVRPAETNQLMEIQQAVSRSSTRPGAAAEEKDYVKVVAVFYCLKVLQDFITAREH